MVRASKYRHWTLQLVCVMVSTRRIRGHMVNRCILHVSTGLGHWIGQGTPDWRWKWHPGFESKYFLISALSVCTVLQHALASNMGFPGFLLAHLSALTRFWQLYGVPKWCWQLALSIKAAMGNGATTWWGEAFFSDNFSRKLNSVSMNFFMQYHRMDHLLVNTKALDLIRFSQSSPHHLWKHPSWSWRFTEANYIDYAFITSCIGYCFIQRLVAPPKKKQALLKRKPHKLPMESGLGATICRYLRVASAKSVVQLTISRVEKIHPLHTFLFLKVWSGRQLYPIGVAPTDFV